MHVFFSLICCYRDPTKSLKMGTGKTSLLLYSNILLWEMRKKIVFKMRYWASQVVLVVKNPSENAEDERCRCNPWVQKISWRRAWQPTPVFLPGESPWTGAWQAAVHGVARVGHDLATTPPPPAPI